MKSKWMRNDVSVLAVELVEIESSVVEESHFHQPDFAD